MSPAPADAGGCGGATLTRSGSCSWTRTGAHHQHDPPLRLGPKERAPGRCHALVSLSWLAGRLSQEFRHLFGPTDLGPHGALSRHNAERAKSRGRTHFLVRDEGLLLPRVGETSGHCPGDPPAGACPGAPLPTGMPEPVSLVRIPARAQVAIKVPGLHDG